MPTTTKPKHEVKVYKTMADVPVEERKEWKLVKEICGMLCYRNTRNGLVILEKISGD